MQAGIVKLIRIGAGIKKRRRRRFANKNNESVRTGIIKKFEAKSSNCQKLVSESQLA